MAKSIMRIEFDRADRMYRGGETVGGVLRIQGNNNLTWHSITLSKYWEICGKGGTDNNLSDKKEVVPHGKLKAGEVLECPFSFTADCVPVTYQGQLINVDHYCCVQMNLADLSNEKDPQTVEKYNVRPGQRPPQFTGCRDSLIHFPGHLLSPESECQPHRKRLESFREMVLRGSQVVAKCAEKIGVPVNVVVFALLLIGIFLFPALVGAVVVLGMIFLLMLLLCLNPDWKMFINKSFGVMKIFGEMKIDTPHRIVCPGENWPFELKLDPSMNLRIRGITAFLVAQENTRSSNPPDKVEQREVFKKVYKIHPADSLKIGRPFQRQFRIPFPDTEIYSVCTHSNKIQWTVEIQLEVGGWGGPIQGKTLQVLPVEFFEDRDSSEDKAAAMDAAAEALADLVNSSDAVTSRQSADPQPATDVLDAEVIIADEAADPQATTDVLDSEEVIPDTAAEHQKAEVAPSDVTADKPAREGLAPDAEREVYDRASDDQQVKVEVFDSVIDEQDVKVDVFDPAAVGQDVPTASSPLAVDSAPAENERASLSLTALAAELTQASSLAEERHEIIKRVDGQSLQLSVEVDRVATTFRSSIADSHRKGKTITGTIMGTQQTIELLLLNDTDASQLARGDRWQGSVAVADWDTLFKRLRLLEVSVS